MEDPQSLSAVESFANTWLANPNCSFRLSFDAADRLSFIEMDPNLTPSKRFLVSQDFDFKVPESHLALRDADKLISNGTLVLLEAYSPSSDFGPVSAPHCSSTQAKGRFGKSRSMSLRKCNKLPKIIIQKYMDLVRPLWCRMRCGRSDRSRVQGVENWEYSGSGRNGACWADNRRRSCDSESSIHDAVVHCKKTIGMR